MKQKNWVTKHFIHQEIREKFNAPQYFKLREYATDCLDFARKQCILSWGTEQ